MSLVSEVQTMLNEVNETVFWETSHLYDAINSAQLEVYAKAKPITTSATLPINQGDDFVILPKDIFIPQLIECDGKVWFITTQARLEQHSRSWRGEELGTPKWFVKWDYNHLRCWPRPAEASDDWTIWGTSYPTELTSSNTGLTLGDRDLQLAVVYLAVSRLVDYTLPQSAQTYLRESEIHLNKYKTRLRNNLPHNIRRLIPDGSKFNKSLSGNIKIGGSL